MAANLTGSMSHVERANALTARAAPRDRSTGGDKNTPRRSRPMARQLMTAASMSEERRIAA